MTERERYLRSICERPADDLPRLAFADWLDENGEANFAEYIRLEIKLAVLTRKREKPDPTDAARVMELVSTLDYSDDFLDYAESRRGFVYKAVFTQNEFLRHARRLFGTHPITSVSLRDRFPIASIGTSHSWTWTLDVETPPLGSRERRSQLENSAIHPLIVEAATRAGIGLLVTFPTASAASKALSRACVAWGRERAGLPPLERKKAK